MADYKVAFKASVDKDLADLPKNLVARVWQRFELLNGDYRIIYGVDVQAKEVVIHHVRHRREVYRSL